eukprot:3664281-Lingulodinium_polyedra.AAC.1
MPGPHLLSWVYQCCQAQWEGPHVLQAALEPHRDNVEDKLGHLCSQGILVQDRSSLHPRLCLLYTSDAADDM